MDEFDSGRIELTTAAGLPAGVSPLRMAVASYLARFTGATRRAYDLDVRVFLGWCTDMNLDPFAVTRPMIELYVRWMQEMRGYAPATVARRLSTVCGFYRMLVIDGLLPAAARYRHFELLGWLG